MRILKAIGIIFGLLLVYAILDGATGRPAATSVIVPAAGSPAGSAAATAVPTTSAPQAKVGDTVRFGNWAYTVTKVEKAKTLAWSEFGNKVDALGEFVVVHTTLRNIGSQNFTINNHDFKLADSGGVQYDTSTKFEVFSVIRHMKLTSLGEQFPPGIDVATALIFDVNPAATGLKLVLKQANNATITLG